MGYISDYDMELLLSGDQENLIRKITENRSFGVFSVDDKQHGKPYYYYSWEIKDTNGVADSTKRRYLCLSNERGVSDDTGNLQNFNSPSVEWLLEELKGKTLSYTVRHHGGGTGDTEKIINRDFLERILLLYEDDDQFLINDEFFDIKVFLRCIGNNQSAQKYIKPTDIRGFNINGRIIRLLRSNSNILDRDTIIAEYAAVSEDIQAQYFVTSFHSNRLWDEDPVCIHVYRISAFIIPGEIPFQEASELSKNKTAINYINGNRYMIDSIHFNNDICFDWAEFKQLIGFYRYIIACA